MRILWLMTRYWPAVGGAETHARQIIHELTARGHHVQVVTHWDEHRDDWLRGVTIAAPATRRDYTDGAARVTRLGYTPWRRLQTVAPALTYYLRPRGAARALARPLTSDIRRAVGQNWDIVHGVRIGREPLYLAGRDLARASGAPFVFTPLHHPRWEGRRYQGYLDLYRDADALVALTQSEAQTLARLGAAPERIGVHGIGPVLPETASGERFRAAHSVTGPLVLYLGQKYPYKGWTRLLEVAPAIWRRWPNVTFAFAGPRTSASRRAFARVHDPRILELDTLDLQTKGDALAACDIFCLPSTQESFGGVYTEAWANAKPVIGCAIPAVRDVISDGVDGLLAPPGDSAGLTAAIEALLADPARAAALGRAGQENVAQRFSWARIVDDLEAIYRAALARTQSGPPSPTGLHGA